VGGGHVLNELGIDEGLLIVLVWLLSPVLIIVGMVLGLVLAEVVQRVRQYWRLQKTKESVRAAADMAGALLLIGGMAGV
jgi:hypothetical protein